jgi:hypothetical protein
MSHQGLDAIRNFHSIYFSKMALGEYTVYYNFLYYLVVVPFVYITPLYLAIKLFAVLIAALCCTIVYLCLRWLAVKQPFLWTCFLFAITGYLGLLRLFLSRPYVLAPFLLLLLVVCCFKKQYVWVGIISFAYLFWHSLTFFFPFVVGFAYYFFDYFYTQKHNWRILLAVTGGTALAIGVSYLLIPGFLHYAWDVVFGIFNDTIIGKKVLIPEGGELYPSNFFDTINTHIVLFPLFSIALITQVLQIKKYWPGRGDSATPQKIQHLILGAVLFFLSLGFFVGTITISQRFGDFFIFFSWVLIAYSFNGILDQVSFAASIVKNAVIGGIIISFTYFFVNNTLLLQEVIANASAPEEFMHVGEWFSKNTQKGDIIFEPNWSWFTQLYYYSPDNNYIMGLEPRFLYEYSPSLYWKWAHIVQNGYVCEVQDCPALQVASERIEKNEKIKKEWNKVQGDQIATTILQDFKSRYIISSEDFAIFNQVLDNNKHFKKVYGEEKRYFIYQIIP